MNSFTDTKFFKFSLTGIYTVAVAVVLNLFVYYALETVHPQPEYANFCATEQIVAPATTNDSCVARGGQWTANTPTTKTEPLGYCNEQYTCGKQYDAANKSYDKTAFFVLFSIGLFAVLVSMIRQLAPVVRLGGAVGGVVLILGAAIAHFGSIGSLARLLVLAGALVLLVFLAQKKLHD
jgi:uncharacterized protein (DUF983 family)